MRSRIYASEIVENRERRFGSATAYYPAALIGPDGAESALLFTEDQLREAGIRARLNSEDVERALSARPPEDAPGERHAHPWAVAATTIFAAFLLIVVTAFVAFSL